MSFEPVVPVGTIPAGLEILETPISAAAAASSSIASPLVSVIVPIFNEQSTILQILDRLDSLPFDAELILVDDGSTDGTSELLKEVDGRVGCRVLRHAINRGKGAAIRTGLKFARGRFVVIQDADLEYDPADLDTLLQPLLEGRGEAVYGSRYLHGPQADRFRLFRHGVRLLNLVTRLVYGIRLTDEATCYKMLSTNLLRRMDLQCERFEFCPEVTAKLCRLGVPILEVPVAYRPRTAREGKKLCARDGWEAIRVLWRYRKWAPISISTKSCIKDDGVRLDHSIGNEVELRACKED